MYTQYISGIESRRALRAPSVSSVLRHKYFASHSSSPQCMARKVTVLGPVVNEVHTICN